MMKYLQLYILASIALAILWLGLVAFNDRTRARKNRRRNQMCDPSTWIIFAVLLPGVNALFITFFVIDVAERAIENLKRATRKKQSLKDIHFD